jgi:hypothetical protein
VCWRQSRAGSRRIGWSRAEAKARAKLALLWQRQGEAPAGTAAECMKVGKEPLRRLENLRRRLGAALVPMR